MLQKHETRSEDHVHYSSNDLPDKLANNCATARDISCA